MKLDHLYRATFTTPESWSIDVNGEGQSFLIAEGRAEGRALSARLRAANYPRRRSDGVLTPDFRGVLETDDGATIVFSWNGLTRSHDGRRELVGSLTHLSDDDRYRAWNDGVCAVAGEVRERDAGGFDVVLDVFELVWQPLAREL